MDKCPVCGYDERRATQREHNIMNQYVNAANPKDMAVFNSVEAQIVIGNITYKRVTNSSGEIKTVTPTQPVFQTPTVIPTKEVIVEPAAPAAVVASPTTPVSTTPSRLPGA